MLPCFFLDKLSFILHFSIADIQECPVQFESFKHNQSAMQLSWLPNAIEFNTDIDFASFQLLEIKYRNCSEKFASGTFPCQEVRFVLQRKLGYFFIQVLERIQMDCVLQTKFKSFKIKEWKHGCISGSIQVYMPSILTVMLSWLAFWVEMDAGSQVSSFRRVKTAQEIKHSDRHQLVKSCLLVFHENGGLCALGLSPQNNVHRELFLHTFGLTKSTSSCNSLLLGKIEKKKRFRPLPNLWRSKYHGTTFLWISLQHFRWTWPYCWCWPWQPSAHLCNNLCPASPTSKQWTSGLFPASSLCVRLCWR